MITSAVRRPRGRPREVHGTEAAAEFAGVSFRQADYWCRAGVIPGLVDRPGSGRPRSWTVDQIAALVVVGRFVRLFPSKRGVCSSDDLVGLARLGHDHDNGFAVRSSAVWEFADLLPVPHVGAVAVVGLHRAPELSR